MAIQSVESRSLVKISGEIFDITEAPSEKSSYIQKQLVEHASGIVVSKLNDDLRDMGRFTRIALHCAVVRQDPELEGSIQKFGIKLATLCDDSAIAIGRFQRTSTTVIETLQAGYSYLLDGLEDMALDNLDDVQQAAEEMEAISKELYEKFQEEGQQLQEMEERWAIKVSDEAIEMDKLFKEAKRAAEEAMKKKESEEANPGLLLDEVRKENKEKSDAIKQAFEDAHANKKSKQNAESRAEDCLRAEIRHRTEAEREKAIAMDERKKQLGDYKSVDEMQSRVRDLEAFLGNGWECFWSSQGTIDAKEKEKDQLYEDLEKIAKQEQIIREQTRNIATREKAVDEQHKNVDSLRSDIKMFQREIDDQKRKSEVLERELLSMAESRKFDLIRTIDEKLQQQDYAGAAMDVIAATKNSLMSIAVTMLQVAGFWNRMAVIAKELQSKKVRNRVAKAVESYSEEKRLKLWTSDGFKKDAIANYAKWVSYRILCDEYMKGITVTRVELYACLKEPIIPTEAAEKLKKLLKHQQQQKEQQAIESAVTE